MLPDSLSRWLCACAALAGRSLEVTISKNPVPA